MTDSNPYLRVPAKNAVVIVSVFAAAIITVMVVWWTVDVLLLLFAGILLAVLFNRLASTLARRPGLAYRWSLTLVLLILGGAFSLLIWLRAPAMVDQTAQLRQTLPQAVEQLRQGLGRYDWGAQVLRQLSDSQALLGNRPDILSRATGVVSSTLGIFADFLVLAFVSIYLAAEPRLYTNGLTRLVPLAKREQARELLSELGETLWWWLLARLSAMTLVGLIVTSGLWLLGIPLAVTLGLLAALLDFVPNFGPIIAAVPAVLLALVQDPWKAVYVALLYFGVQTLEGNVLTPLLQKKAVALPPATVLAAQLVLAVLTGPIGLVLATPLAAVALVLVRRLYVGGALGDQEYVRK